MTDEVSRVFRSTFPLAEADDFRTGSWRAVAAHRDDVRPLHATLMHAFAMAAKMEESRGITLVPDDEDEPEQHRSFRWLYDRSKIVSVGLENAHVRRGDRVVMVLPTSYEFIIAFFALQRLGAIPVPSYPPALLEKAEVALHRIEHVANHCGASFVITNRQLLPLLGQLAHHGEMHDILVVEKLLATRASHAKKAHAHGEDPAFIQYTSGSTGNPKGVLLTHTNLMHNIHASGQAMQISRRDSMCSWLPLYHDMGLIGGMFWGIYWRLPMVLMSPVSFLLRPGRWLWAMHKHKTTLSAAPNFAYGLCVKRVRPREREGLDLSSLRLTLNGAEPVNLKTVTEFEQTFGPHGYRKGVMYPVYGLAEATVAVSFPPPGDEVRHRTLDRAALASGRVLASSAEGASSVVCVGRGVPGHEVRVVDARGHDCAADEVGHVVVRGASLMHGYYRDPKATAAVIHNGWLWTGDLGFLAPEGLYITGRAKDLIILRGKNYYAEDVERVAEHVEGVRPSGAAAFAVYDEEKATDLVVVVCETKLKDDAERERAALQVSDQVAQQCGFTPDEVVLVPPGTIPKTSSGKRQRALCRELYLKDELAPKRTGKRRLALVFARSGAGFLKLLTQRLLKGRREPD